MEHSKERPRPSIPGGAADDGGAAAAGSTDESIGRPGNWREGRYQRSGTPPAAPRANTPKSPPAEQQKPVTLRDYER